MTSGGGERTRPSRSGRPERPARKRARSLLLPQILSTATENMPSALAVASGTVELTYAELDAQSSRLAWVLAGRGIGAEDVVAVDETDAVAFWAVAKTGAAVGTHGSHSVSTAELATEIAAASAESFNYADRVRPLRAENAAIVADAVMTHQGLGGLPALVESLSLSSEARLLGLGAGFLTYVLAASAGASVVHGSDAHATHVFATAGSVRSIEPRGTAGALYLLGEFIDPEPVSVWSAAGWTVSSLYSPLTAGWLGTTGAALIPGGPVSLGSGLAGVTAQVLDSKLRPAPVDEAGELYLSGPGLGRSFGDASSTAAHFLAAADGSRILRTGVKVRTNRAGLFEPVEGPVPGIVPDEPSLLTGFERQVARTPDAVALVAEGASLTYREFADRVFALSRHLVSLGVGPEARVGLAMRRGIDLMVGMYATVSAGGAWVPVDPDHPAERIDYILETAQPVCVLTSAADAFETAVAPVVVIDAVDLSGYSTAVVTDGDRVGPLRSTNIAYVIFTSGSTGRPKGVAVSHAAVINQMRWMNAEYGLTSDDVYLQKTATTFDVSLWGFWMPLMTGARLVLCSPDGHKDPQYVSAMVAEHKATITDFVPSMLSVFIGAAQRDELTTLRHVFAIGEALPAATAQDWFALSDAGLHNLYGPTEAAVSVTYWPAGHSDVVAVPIGVPEWNVRCYVLDGRLNPTPPGIPGELYLAGVQVARGYLTRPDLTSDRFVADPFGGDGGRMYRTGDLVKLRADGVLDYIGRTDFQVKLRGQRIELGEIEADMLGDPAVSQAAAVVRETAAGQQQLVGYAVPVPGASIDVDGLKRLLAEKLPAYMIPEAFVVMDAFPLNTSGKLDRKALPAPEIVAKEFRAPSGLVEETVASVFGHILGIEQVGADDDFFDLGGNSLLATQVAARVGAALDMRIPPRVVFESSSVSELAAAIADHVGEGGHKQLKPQERPERVPLSLAQSRMWFLNRFDPASAVYNIPLAIRLTGDLNVEALRTAVADVVERHEVLRTVYPEHDGVPYQDVRPFGGFDVTPIDVNAAEVLAKAAEVVTTGFDVTADVPVKVAFFSITDAPVREYVLVVVVHHIAGDGYSVGPLARDLMIAYAARANGEAPGWEPLEVQYADFSIWQREVLGSEDDPDSLIAQQEKHWLSELAGLPTVLELPADRKRPSVASLQGASYRFEFDAATAATLTEIGRQRGASLFMVLHAAFSVLLARLSGTSDIAVGTAVAGRDEEALDHLVGMFVNTLVLRTQVNLSASFEAILAETRETDITAFEHADVPFERLVEVINPVRTQAHSPLFQVGLIFQNMGQSAFEMPGLTVTAVEPDVPMSKWDLQLTLGERLNADGSSEGIGAEFTYATDLFDEATIAGFADRLVRIVAAVEADPAIVVGDVELIGANERTLVLDTWNQTAHDVDQTQTLVSMFQAQAARTPTATAVVFENESVTYGAFSAKVNQLARHLQSMGVGPESFVAVGMRRSIDMLALIYAVITAGGAYVPIDPDHPAERIDYILDVAKPVVFLTQEYLDGLDLAGVSAEPLPLAASPDNLAYVIFTSGSTGRPKGVGVSHRAIVNRLEWMQGAYGMTTADAVVQKTPVTFDVSVWELFWPLEIGARLVIAKPDGHRDPEYLAQLIAEHNVTTAHFVPSMMSVFVASESAATASSLRMVFASGEALPAQTAQKLRALIPGVQVHNLYGPTEAAVDVTFHEVTDEDTVTVPIGAPVWNTGLRVLDARLQPVPVGVPGELYLTGVQLARAYVGRPDLTADRFVADPYGPGRMYRTGDLVHWLGNGEVEYIGRTDFQVKLRGLRIELGEIEAALIAHDSVAQSAALVLDTPTGQRLVGYVVPADGAAPDPAALQEFVGQRLPEYMVPATVMVIDAFPLNPSGKLDRKALPTPPIEATAYRAPGTAIEKVIAAVFGDVLFLERVGADDDFFALGGDSITSIKLVARAKAKGVLISPREVFEQRTVAGLASVAKLALLEELPGGPVGEIDPTPAAALYSIRAQSISVATEPIEGDLAVAAEAIWRRHDILRSRVGEAWEVLPADDFDADAYLAESLTAAYEQIDPANGVTVQFGRDFVVAHRLVADSRSLDVIAEDLAKGLRGESLTAEGTSYRRFARALTDASTSEATLDELSRWRMSAAFRTAPLAERVLDPSVDLVSTVRSATAVPEPETTTHLRTTVPEQYYCTTADVAVAAVAGALASWQGSRSVLLGMTTEGRNSVPGTDVTRTVGSFETVYPLAIDLNQVAPDDPDSLVKLVKERLRTIAGEGLGYALLRYVNAETAAMFTADDPSVRVRFGTPATSNPAQPADAALDIVIDDDGSVTFAAPAGLGIDVDALAAAFVTTAESIVARAQQPGAGGPTPSDFALVRIGQDDLDAIIDRYGTVSGIWPLSPLQAGFAFLNLMSGSVADVYTTQVVVELAGDADASRLHKAAQAVVDRYPNLRAGFTATQTGTPVQVVATNAELPWREVDLRAEQDPVAALEALAEADRKTPFDLQSPPLVRFTFVTLADGDFRLVVTNHHILLDGWSSPLLMKDLLVLYATHGDSSVLPDVRPYSDYLEWLTRQDEDAARRRWREALSGAEPTLLSSGAVATATAEPGFLDFALDESTTSALQAVATKLGVTLNTVFQAAWAVLLGAMNGQRDVIFGATVSGRPAELPGIESMVGLFINTIPVRVELEDTETLAQLVRRVQREQAAMLDVHYLGLADIQAASGLHELFDSLVIFESYPIDQAGLSESAVAIDGMSVTGVDSRGGAHYPLMFEVHPGKQLKFVTGYLPHLLDEAAAQTIGNRMVSLLETVAHNPDLPLGDITLINESERELVVHTWNDTRHELDAGLLHEPFVAQAAKTPDAVALVFGDTELTYAEFSDRVFRLARHLVASGVGPEARVGLAMRRGIDLVVGMYATVCAGGAWVPVDPDHPAERIEYILETAQPVCVLTNAEDAFTTDVAPVIVIDSVDLTGVPNDPLTEIDIRPDNTAYVIFTSGSTGRPKGVAVPHAAIANQQAWMLHEYGFTADDVYVQKTATTFDVSLWGYWLPLMVGARLVLATPDGHRDAGYISSLIAQHKATITDFVPSMLSVFVGAADRAELESLRHVFVIGEALPAATARAWKQLSDAGLHNLYGPTEAAVSVTYWPATGDETVSVPIGVPEWNVRCYVLDQHMRLCPPGVAGELYLADVQLARGYLTRPDLTSDRFVASPFGTGERMYRTGDLVRWLVVSDGRSAGSAPAGLLDYIGRTDFQVKLRGQRIELGEIEAAFLSHDDVRQAAVLVLDTAIGQQLVAYVVSDADPSALREHAASRLPRYMVPDAIVVLDEFPLNTSGKLDRKALPVPSVQAAEYRAPSTPYEEIVAGAYAGLLGIDRVGADDDFFALGGNSLLATQLAARISAELDARIPVFAVFEAPTVSELAMRAQSHAGEGGRIALTARERPDHVPLSLAQSRMWFLNQMDPASPIYNLPLAIRITGPLDVAAMQAAIGDVVARHEVLRTVYPRTAEGPSQVVVHDAAPDLTPIAVSENDVIARVAEVLGAGFDVTAAVPLRVALFDITDTNEYVLAVVVHHIAGDGFSMAPLARDVMVAYGSRTRGDAPDWQPLPVQYADYTLWQRDVLGSDADPNSLVSKQIEYWRTQLDGVPESLTLAGSKPRPDVFSFRGANAHFTVTDEVSHALGEIARSHGVTPFMVLHAALAVLLSKLSATDDITIGTPIAGRGERELDDMVGMFVNTLVLRTPVDARESFSALLRRVRDTDLAAFGHADVPFERLVDALNPVRSTAHTPLFQVILSFQSAVNTRFELGDLVLAPVEFDAGMAKFDLQVTIAETVGDDGQLSGLAGEFNYATDLFDAATIDGVIGRWNRLLAAIAADPDRAVGNFTILDEDERAELVSQVGPGEVKSRTLPEIFADAVRLNPDGEALYFDGFSMTYREADEYTNKLARVLIERGIGPEDRVAVGISRSAHSVLSEWAITKTGAAFVPVDPRYPVDRIAHMVSDSGSTIGLTRQAHLGDLPDAVDWFVLDAPESKETIDAASVEHIADGDRVRPLRLTNTAYVIYTSGSTGLPKGVLVSHTGLGSFTDAQGDSYGVRADSRVLHFASPSFDASVLEMTFALSAGATLVIIPTDVYGGADLAAALRDQAVTHLFITPAALASIDPTGLDSLEVLAVGGEAYSPELVRRWGNGRKFFNVYGPTEASMVTNIGEPLAPGDQLTIGQLVRGVRAVVLDKALQPVPAGVAGDLYLAGDQLARGYHDRFGLTAGKFVADPYGPAGSRMYHTGDVVRWTPDWRLDYVGRSDFQVKIRGFRVELGEIDVVFMSHPEVDLAATIAHRVDGGLDALVTYVAGAAGAQPTAAELREFVASRLAGHMVPASIMVLDEIPLNPSGKLNRSALPAPVFEAAEFRAPQTPTEIVVADAFASVLGLERVGADDDFFALGGNSLAAVSARADIAERLGKDIRLQWFFTNSTVHQLAATIDESGSGTEGLGIVLPFRETGDRPPLFCVHPAVGLATMYAALIPFVDGGRPLYGLQTPGLLDLDYGPSTLSEVAAMYLAEVRRVQPTGPYNLLGWSLGGAIAQEMAVQLQAVGETVGSLVILDSRHEISPETIHSLIRDGLAGLGIELEPGEDLGNMSEERAQELFRVLDAAALSLTVDHVRGLFRSALHNVELLNAFTPSVYAGDAVFVGADGEPDEIVDGELLWGPVTSGTITQVRVPQKHDQMLFPEALERWADDLEGWLS